MLLPFIEFIAAKQIKTGDYSDLEIPSLLVKIYNHSNRFDLNEYTQSNQLKIWMILMKNILDLDPFSLGVKILNKDDLFLSEKHPAFKLL